MEHTGEPLARLACRGGGRRFHSSERKLVSICIASHDLFTFFFRVRSSSSLKTHH